ncbi:N-acetylmuramoyl-L-alanine amidase, partial [Rhodothalassium salexigens]|uniref:N-acetylmuramoyl-L-alanine amidase n=2 Tax=Rhodothalassium salexigens TaxID=1086 RepID=UPI00191307EA
MGADPLPSRLPLPAIVDHPSPNHGPRRGGTAPDMIVLHYTGMASAAAALDRLCDPAAQVSAHYLVDEDGALRRLVDEQRRAWHAGQAHWAGEADINSRSIGIEIVNGGHDFGLPTYPAVQVDAVVALVGDICARWAIRPARVVGHADVAPARKADPGEHFPWWRLAAAGLALAGPAEGAGPAEATGPAVDKAGAACLG